MSENIIRGRVWVLLDKDGRPIEDIDTDQIFHNAHLHITDLAQMGPLALGNLEGWKDFGAGSSRQQAVDCFIALKTAAILAPSFSAIYFRNAVNSGFPVVRIQGLEDLVRNKALVSGDEIEIDVIEGRARNLTRAAAVPIEPMSAVQADIYKAGDLFKFGKTAGR